MFPVLPILLALSMLLAVVIVGGLRPHWFHRSPWAGSLRSSVPIDWFVHLVDGHVRVRVRGGVIAARLGTFALAFSAAAQWQRWRGRRLLRPLQRQQIDVVGGEHLAHHLPEATGLVVRVVTLRGDTRLQATVVGVFVQEGGICGEFSKLIYNCF